MTLPDLFRGVTLDRPAEGVPDGCSDDHRDQTVLRVCHVRTSLHLVLVDGVDQRFQPASSSDVSVASSIWPVRYFWNAGVATVSFHWA